MCYDMSSTHVTGSQCEKGMGELVLSRRHEGWRALAVWDS